MSSFGFGSGQTPNYFNPPKPFSETKTAFGWSPFGNTTPSSGANTIPALATNNATSGTASSPAFDFTPVFGAPVFNTASAPASGTNCTITLATTGSPVFGTSTPTIGTTATITPGVGTSSAPTGGTNAIAITINVGTASTSSVGNGITIAPSVGSTVTIAPASGTSTTLMQAAGTTITITSNPTSGATSTPGIGAASTLTVCFPTSTAPASTRSGFGFPTSTSPASTQGGFGFPTSTAPASTQGGFGFPTSTTPASTSTSSSSKVGASSQFGMQSSPFGAQSTPIVGNNASRQSASGSHQGRGSRVAPYTASIDADSFSAASPIKIHSISAMPIHKHKCHEELRWEDYQLGDKGGAVPPGGSSKHTTQSFVQKEKHASFCPFGCPFAQTSSSTFNTSTSSPCATSLFAQPRPFAQPSSNPFGPRPSPSPFGPQPSPSPFGAQPPSSTFGAKPSSSTFGPPPSSSPFGAQPSSSIFGPPPSSSPFGAIFGNSTSAPSSFGQTSSPNPSWFMPSQVSQPVETSTSPFHSNLTNTAGSLPSFY